MELIAVLITYQGEPAIMGIARDVTEREQYISGMARKTKTLTIINRIIQIASQKRDDERTSGYRTLFDPGAPRF